MTSTHTCLSQSCIPNGTFLLLDGLWILWAHGNDDYYYYHGFEASDTGKKQHPGERRGGKYGTAGGQALLQRKTRCIYLGRELCVFLLLFSLGPTAKRWMREYPLYSSCLRALAFFLQNVIIKMIYPQQYPKDTTYLKIVSTFMNSASTVKPSSFLEWPKHQQGDLLCTDKVRVDLVLTTNKKTSSHAQRGVRNEASGPLLHDDA